jgi:hypothetical protein
MRVVKVGEDMFVQVKNNGVWEVATEQNIIPKSPNARAEYDAYVQHQKDLLRSWVHNQFMKPEELNKQISDATNRLKRMDSLIQKESTRPMRPIQNNDTWTESRPNTSIWQQSTLSHSDTIDPHAKTRIEKEHGLDGSQAPLAKSDLLGGSFRAEIADMMKMDDVTFQKNFTEVQYRKWKEGNRPYEAEMYEAATKVRKMSDADIIAHADDIIAGNREFLTSRHPNRGPSDLTLDAKALLIAENAAIRQRLANIIDGKVPGGIVGITDDAAKGNKSWLIDKLKWIAPWIVAAILAALLLWLIPGCDPEKWKKPTWPVTPEGLADAICKACDPNTPQATPDYKRKNEYGKTLTETYRNDISKRWINTKEWKDTIVKFQANRSAVSQNSAQSNNVANALDAVIKSSTVANIQKLQKCISLTGDSKQGQDGILGPITTRAINEIINSCIAPSSSTKPAAPVAAATAPAPAVPAPDPASTLNPNNPHQQII